VKIRRERKGAGRVSVGKSDGKTPFGRSGLDGRIVLREGTALIRPNLCAGWVWAVNAMGPAAIPPRKAPI